MASTRARPRSRLHRARSPAAPRLCAHGVAGLRCPAPAFEGTSINSRMSYICARIACSEIAGCDDISDLTPNTWGWQKPLEIGPGWRAFDLRTSIQTSKWEQGSEIWTCNRSDYGRIDVEHAGT